MVLRGAWWSPGLLLLLPDNAAYPVIPPGHLLQQQQHHRPADRGFGEVSYAFTDRMRLTVGERVAHTTFSLEHYATALKNYGRGGLG